MWLIAVSSWAKRLMLVKHDCMRNEDVRKNQKDCISTPSLSYQKTEQMAVVTEAC